MGLHNGQFIDLLGLSSICAYAISTKFKIAYLVLGYSAVNHLTQELFFLTSEFDSNTFPTPCQSFLYMHRSAKRPPYLLHVQFTSPCSGQIALCSNIVICNTNMIHLSILILGSVVAECLTRDRRAVSKTHLF